MARRRWGSGSVYRRRSDGRWVASARLADGSARTTYHRAEAAARASLDRLLALRAEGVVGPDPTLGEYLRAWLAEVRPAVSHATWRRHEAIVRIHVAPALGRVRLGDLSVAQVRAWLRGSTLHPQTVSHLRATLRRALADALRDGLVARNVASLATPPPVPHRERAWLDSAGVRLLLDKTRPAKPRRGRKPPLPPGGRLHALWALAATAGLRMGEALALSWDDVDLDAATVRVSRTLHREAGEWVTMEPKTRGSRRLVPLTPLAVEALRGHRLRQAEERLAAGSPGRGGLVFATRPGAPLHGSNVLAALYRAEDAAGLGRVPFHGLRHSAASVMMEAGVPMRVVSELLGHSTIRITSDLYSHVAPAVSRDAAERVQRALSGG